MGNRKTLHIAKSFGDAFGSQINFIVYSHFLLKIKGVKPFHHTLYFFTFCIKLSSDNTCFVFRNSAFVVGSFDGHRDIFSCFQRINNSIYPQARGSIVR